MNSNIQQALHLKRSIYLLEQDIGDYKENLDRLRCILRDTPVSILSVPWLHEKLKSLCIRYSVRFPLPTSQDTSSQKKRTKGEKSIEERLLQNEISSVLLELTTKMDKKQQYFNLENICIVMILGSDFKKFPEIENRIEVNILDHIEQKHSDLDTNTINSLRRVNVLCCFALFLQGRYLEASQKIFQFLDKDVDILDSAVWDIKHHLLSKDEVYCMITICILLAIPIEEYRLFSQLTDVLTLFERIPFTKDLFTLAINTRFNIFFKQWREKVIPICERNPLIGPRISDIKQTMRMKVYILYLSISSRIQISYLSRTLEIQYNIVLNDIKKLFFYNKLNFVLDGDIMTYKGRSILSDISSILKSNENEISELLERQKSQNIQIRDSIQSYIRDNNEKNNIKVNYDEEDSMETRSNSNLYSMADDAK